MVSFAKPPCDEAVIRATRPSPECSARAAPWVLATTILGSSLVFVDGTVVNVALPALQSGLSATIVDVQWVVESYALLLASLLLVGGSLGDRYGRRRVFCIGVAVFAAASAWCGAAPDVTHLIIARSVQGIGGALLVPNSLAIVGASFAEQERGRALGIWSGFTGITAVVGPVLGGFLIDHYSWRWVFLINLPLAAVVLILAYWHVPESRDEEAADMLDWLGAVLVTIGLGGIVYGLIESSNKNWAHPSVLVGLVGGLLALMAFVTVELRAASPMLPLALFRSRNFTGANLLTFLLYAAVGWCAVLPSVEFDPGTRLLRHIRGRGLSAIHTHHVCSLALGRRVGRPVRRENTADRWSSNRGARICIVRAAPHRRELLDHVFSGGYRAGFRNGHKRGAVNHNGAQRRGQKRVGDSFWSE